jgi:hypothetical protein
VRGKTSGRDTRRCCCCCCCTGVCSGLHAVEVGHCTQNGCCYCCCYSPHDCRSVVTGRRQAAGKNSAAVQQLPVFNSVLTHFWGASQPSHCSQSHSRTACCRTSKHCSLAAGRTRLHTLLLMLLSGCWGAALYMPNCQLTAPGHHPLCFEALL